MFNYRLAMRLPPYLLFTNKLDSDPNAHSITRVADFIYSYLVSVTGHTSLFTIILINLFVHLYLAKLIRTDSCKK